MITTLKYLFPQTSHRVAAGVLTLFLFVYLVQIPLAGGPAIFETFYRAALHLSQGLNPYDQYPGFNYFKYGPFFIYLPLTVLTWLPLLPAAIIWQLGSALLYVLSLLYLFTGVEKKSFRPSLAFACLFPLVACLDLSSNGIYLQSNTFMLGGLVLGLALYRSHHTIASALVLAYVTNMKVVPLVLTLLLCLDSHHKCNKKFIIATLSSHLLLLLAPVLLQSGETAKMLYRGWWSVLTIDKELKFGREEIHHYLSLRPVLKVLFDIEFNRYYFLFAAGVGAFIGGKVFLNLKKQFSQSDLRQLLVLSLTYILVFNTRTEGPSLVLLGPVYAITFWGLYTNQVWKGYPKKVAWALFLGSFFFVSISCSDLFSGTAFQEWMWENNLRGIGLMFFFFVACVSLFWKQLKQQLFD